MMRKGLLICLLALVVPSPCGAALIRGGTRNSPIRRLQNNQDDKAEEKDEKNMNENPEVNVFEDEQSSSFFRAALNTFDIRLQATKKVVEASLVQTAIQEYLIDWFNREAFVAENITLVLDAFNADDQLDSFYKFHSFGFFVEDSIDQDTATSTQWEALSDVASMEEAFSQYKDLKKNVLVTEVSIVRSDSPTEAIPEDAVVEEEKEEVDEVETEPAEPEPTKEVTAEPEQAPEEESTPPAEEDEEVDENEAEPTEPESTMEVTAKPDKESEPAPEEESTPPAENVFVTSAPGAERTSFVALRSFDIQMKLERSSSPFPERRIRSILQDYMFYAFAMGLPVRNVTLSLQVSAVNDREAWLRYDGAVYLKDFVPQANLQQVVWSAQTQVLKNRPAITAALREETTLGNVDITNLLLLGDMGMEIDSAPIPEDVQSSNDSGISKTWLYVGIAFIVVVSLVSVLLVIYARYWSVAGHLKEVPKGHKTPPPEDSANGTSSHSSNDKIPTAAPVDDVISFSEDATSVYTYSNLYNDEIGSKSTRSKVSALWRRNKSFDHSDSNAHGLPYIQRAMSLDQNTVDGISSKGSFSDQDKILVEPSDELLSSTDAPGLLQTVSRLLGDVPIVQDLNNVPLDAKSSSSSSSSKSQSKGSAGSRASYRSLLSEISRGDVQLLSVESEAEDDDKSEDVEGSLRTMESPLGTDDFNCEAGEVASEDHTGDNQVGQVYDTMTPEQGADKDEDGRKEMEQADDKAIDPPEGTSEMEPQAADDDDDSSQRSKATF